MPCTRWDMTILAYDGSCYFPALAPRRYLYPLGSGTLGYAWPAALGAAAALPGTPVLAVAGDGGIHYGLTELATARQYGLDAKLLIVDDGGYGVLREYQQGRLRRDPRGRSRAARLRRGLRGLRRPRAARLAGESGGRSRLGLRDAWPGGGGAEDARSLDPDVTDWAGLVKPSLVGVAPYDPGESVSELMARHGLERGRGS